MTLVRIARLHCVAKLVGATPSQLGEVSMVHAAAGALRVYSASGTADLGALRRLATYLRTDFDVWCWYGRLPKRPLGYERESASDPWPLDVAYKSDLERHEFRVPDHLQATAEALFSQSANRLSPAAQEKLQDGLESARKHPSVYPGSFAPYADDNALPSA
jgi:hypothetical protein